MFIENVAAHKKLLSNLLRTHGYDNLFFNNFFFFGFGFVYFLPRLMLRFCVCSLPLCFAWFFQLFFRFQANSLFVSFNSL